MQLVERSFAELSRLHYRIFTCELDGALRLTALVLQFTGVYGFCSDGNGDADFMRVITRAALEGWHANAVVFDLRQLDYKGGDAIWNVFTRRVFTADLPRALIVADRCRQGFSTCRDLIPPMFDDLESAIEFVAPRARAVVDRLFAELDGIAQEHRRSGGAG